MFITLDLVAMLLEGLARQHLCEEVRRIVVGRHVLDRDEALAFLLDSPRDSPERTDSAVHRTDRIVISQRCVMLKTRTHSLRQAT